MFKITFVFVPLLLVACSTVAMQADGALEAVRPNKRIVYKGADERFVVPLRLPAPGSRQYVPENREIAVRLIVDGTDRQVKERLVGIFYEACPKSTCDSSLAVSWDDFWERAATIDIEEGYSYADYLEAIKANLGARWGLSRPCARNTVCSDLSVDYRGSGPMLAEMLVKKAILDMSGATADWNAVAASMGDNVERVR